MQRLSLGELGRGELGYTFAEQEQAHRFILRLARLDETFTPVDGRRVVCIDSRLWELAMRLPGGELLLAYMWHFLTAEPYEKAHIALPWQGFLPETHRGCAFTHLGTAFVQEVFEDPTDALRLLARMGYDTRYGEMICEEVLKEWAHVLPSDFTSLCADVATAEVYGEQNLVAALLNSREGTTFNGQPVLYNETGLGVLSVDMWAGGYIARRLTNDHNKRWQLEWMVLVLVAATLLRLGSSKLRLIVC